MASGHRGGVLWRQDDNGQVFVMCRFHSRQQAERACARYQNRGHKQLYWVTTLAPRGPQ